MATEAFDFDSVIECTHIMCQFKDFHSVYGDERVRVYQPAPDRLDALAARLREWRRSFDLPGVGLVVTNAAQTLLCVTCGARDLQRGEAFGRDTLFPVGSLTKGLTATLAAMLVDAGRVGWESPLTPCLQELRWRKDDGANELTLRDLLCHRGGFGDMSLLYGGNRVSPAQVMRQMTSAEAYCPPGERFLYNNIHYFLVGEIVARLTSRSWREALQERLLDPLQMSATCTRSEDFLDHPRRALGYHELDLRPGWLEAPFLPFDLCAAAGGVQSTLTDMAKWLRFLLRRGDAGNGPRLAPQRFVEMWTPHEVMSPSASYGLGWELGDVEGRLEVRHQGNLPGYSATLGLLPTQGVGFVFFANASETPLQQGICHQVWETLGLREPDEEPVADSPALRSPAKTTQLEGHYRSGLGAASWGLFLRRGRLRLDLPGQRPTRLLGPDARGRYHIHPGGDLHFTSKTDPHSGARRLVLTRTLSYPGVKVSRRDREALEREAPTLPDCTGHYHLPGLAGELVMRLEDGRLVVVIPNDGTYLLERVASSRWSLVRDPGQSVRFHRDGRGRVTSLTWKIQREHSLGRVEQRLAGITVQELLALRYRAEGRHRRRGCRLALTARIHYPHQGLRGTVTVRRVEPDRFFYEEDLGPFGALRQVRRGDRVWIENTLMGQEARELEGEHKELFLARFALDAAFAGIGDWRAGLESLRLLGPSPLSHATTHVAWLLPRNGPPRTRYVCQETGLVLREVCGAQTQDFSEFRPVAGSQMAFRVVTETLGPSPGRSVLTIDAVNEEPSFSDADFSL